MKKKFLIILVFLLGIGTYAVFSGDSSAEKAKEAHDDHGAENHGHAEGGDEHGHGHEEEGHSESTTIDPAVASESGIEITQAGAQDIRQTVSITGRIALNQNATAQVKARFPGIVREVKKSVGDKVNTGDVLATVESNESLQVYPVKSPMKGTVLTRTTNPGDTAGDAPIFTISNLEKIWAEFHVFPRDIARVKTGQKIRVSDVEGSYSADAVIEAMLPVAEASSQTVVVRVVLDNADSMWRSGMTVRGDAVISEKQVAVAVKSAAIQRMENQTVVFVQEGESYQQRTVKTGADDGEWTEVLEGLKAGERYVSKNSFLIKADIGKAGAEHEH